MAPPDNRAKWPSALLLARSTYVDDAGPIRFVDTAAAARHLALDAHSLECYRSLDIGPAFYKFGRYVRYAVADLDAWAESCRRTPGAAPKTPPLRSIDPHSSEAI